MIAAFDLGASLTGLATLVAALAALVTALRTKGQSNATQAKVAEVAQTVSDTHDLVNGAATRQDQRIEVLSDAVRDAGGIVPPIPDHSGGTS